MIFDIL